MSSTWTRRPLALALLLAVGVVGASSFLRLGTNGLGCRPWPACYATPDAGQVFNAGAAAQTVRLAHRVAASTFLVVALVVVAGSWRQWRTEQRHAGIAVLGVTVALAALGPLTPSAQPWITLSNALGGLVLAALVFGLWRSTPAGPRVWTRSAVLLTALVFVQALSGVLLSVRLARTDCTPACSAPASGSTPALFNPVRAGSAYEITGSKTTGSAMHVVHWMTGLALVAALVGWALGAPAGARTGFLALSAGTVFLLGALQTELARPALGAGHAMAAAVLLGCCALVLCRPRAAQTNRGTA